MSRSFPLRASALPQNFPRRNRIISGLSLGTIVVEAQIKSGSLITAKFALEQGREVFAVSGSIFNPLSSGCHQLIQDGAKLIQSAEDVHLEFGFMPPSPSINLTPPAETKLSPEQQSVLDLMGIDPVGIDQLQQASGLTIEKLSAMLLELELEDKVAKSTGGLYQKIQ